MRMPHAIMVDVARNDRKHLSRKRVEDDVEAIAEFCAERGYYGVFRTGFMNDEGEFVLSDKS